MPGSKTCTFAAAPSWFVAAQMQCTATLTMRCLLSYPASIEIRAQLSRCHPMTAYRSLKVFSHVVLGLMVVGSAYACVISVVYWTGISV
jgi:hypothetical protein